jgi:hypothetical protein
MANLGQYAKAFVAAGVAGLSALVPVLDDGHLSLTDGVIVALAALVAAGSVWAIPNKPAT